MDELKEAMLLRVNSTMSSGQRAGLQQVASLGAR